MALDQATAITDLGGIAKQLPLLSGLIGLWGVALLTFVTKDVPAKVWKWIRRWSCISIQIPSSEDDFYRVVNWIESRGYAEKTRSIRITRSKITPGLGVHWLLFDGRFFQVIREKDDSSKGGLSYKPREEITVRTYGRKQKPIRDLIATIRTESASGDTTIINFWRDQAWTRLCEQPKRKMNTLFLPGGTRNAIGRHLRTFLANRKWYCENGIPYRTGLCFYGPPGTGKTSIARAICAEHNFKLYTMSLSCLSDSGFQQAMSEVEPNSVVLLEDIDCFQLARIRKAQPPSSVEAEEQTTAPESLTLSGLLNGIDGAAGSDALVFVFTTNHIENIDPALLRPGRIDLSLSIGNHTRETVLQVFERFFPSFAVPAEFTPRVEVSPAYLQGLVLSHQDDPGAVLRAISPPQVLQDRDPQLEMRPAIVYPRMV